MMLFSISPYILIIPYAVKVRLGKATLEAMHIDLAKEVAGAVSSGAVPGC
jgi:hypothetical protein